MKDYEKLFLEELRKIDNNLFSIEIDIKNAKIDELYEIAKKYNNKKWMLFLQSEKQYYNGNYDEAYNLTVEAYNLDQKVSTEDRCFYFAHSLGVSSYESHSYADAEKYYLEAISIDKNAFESYLDLSTLYFSMKKYRESKLKINYVLKNCNDEMFILQAKEHLARLHIKKKEYNEANSLLLELKSKRGDNTECLEALALSYIYLKEYNTAKEYYHEALKLCSSENYKKYINYKISFLELLNPNDIINNSDSFIFSLSFEHLDVLEKVLFERIEKETVLTNYINQYKNNKPQQSVDLEDEFILCLKGWSSSTPTLDFIVPDKDRKRGGGFYVYLNGKGIAVDPGIDFLDNLHNNDMSIFDIDIVIVTHNHIDHNNDLDKIIDLSYQTNHKIYYYLDYETYSSRERLLNEIRTKTPNDAVSITPAFKKIDIGGTTDMYLEICKTDHDKACPSSFAFKLVYNNIVIGFTSDTKCTPDIKEFFKDVPILIANISETNADDIVLVGYKDNHLGIHGVYDILKENTSDTVTCLLSEFWGGLGDIRLDMADILQGYLHNPKYTIVPVDIGNKFYFNNKTFLCNSCEERTANYNIVRIGTHNTKSLRCVCSKCFMPILNK